MELPPRPPHQTEIYGSFRRHVGPRFIGAGLRVTFLAVGGPPGIFVDRVPEEFREAVRRGLGDAMAERFPGAEPTWGIQVTRADADNVESSEHAFRLVARMVVEQAYGLRRPLDD